MDEYVYNFRMPRELEFPLKVRVAELEQEIRQGVSIAEVMRQLIELFVTQEKVYEEVKASVLAQSGAQSDSN